MRETRIRIIALCGTLLLAGAACSGRSVGLSEDGGSAGTDSASNNNNNNTSPDACVRPEGGCHSDEDCASGLECVGCGPDPCCPHCRVCYGRCLPTKPPPPPHCIDTKDCGPEEYCHLDPGECLLAGAQPGECMPRPEGCPFWATCPWICGCDGVSYCSPCEAQQAGTNVAYKGKCATTCKEIYKAYKTAVEQAKTCAPEDPNIPCTLKVWDNLPTGCPCSCETYVNPANKAALQLMKVLEQKWVGQKCGPGLPPPDMTCCALYPSCITLSGASCSSAGICKDLSTSAP